VMGSCVLFSLYCVFKLFDKEYVNILLKCYFMLLGVGAMSMTLHPFVKDVCHMVFPKESCDRLSKEHKFAKKIPFCEEPLEIEGDLILAFCAGFSLLVSAWFLYSKHWCGNNIVGICFSIQAIEQMGLGSVKIGMIVLVGLFFYDIFWVFGTDVMVSVATKFDAPIKLLFPRQLATDDTSIVLQMLGLGDIVMPGIFCAILLRFDFHQALEKTGHGNAATKLQSKLRDTLAFEKPYFNACVFAYVAGLIFTVFVMHHFQHAQPALLYLVPACIGSALVTGVARGELGALLAFSEEEETDVKKQG